MFIIETCFTNISFTVYTADILQTYVTTPAPRSASAHLQRLPLGGELEFLARQLPSLEHSASSLASFKIGLKTYLFKAAFS